ncbi:MAG TPA: TM2 domain-containing protein [Spirochaetia bacterium]|nr:TM2 domain-containing protein [Spirochaetia bacterium]
MQTFFYHVSDGDPATLIVEGNPLKTVELAYLFWVPSVFGLAGLQRFYLGKPGTGILYLLTCGLFGIGTIYDLFTLPRQVREAQLYDRLNAALAEGDRARVGAINGPNGTEPRETIEHLILRVAKSEGGIATPAGVALEGNITTDQAKEYLEKLLSKGIAEIRVKKSGQLVYVFPDFFDEKRSTDFEDI